MVGSLINGFDFDGVLYFGEQHGCCLRPLPQDVIITGRSFEHASFVYGKLREIGIENAVYFNPRLIKDNDRIESGLHKARTLKTLQDDGIRVVLFFEDDDIQKEQIEKWGPSETTVIHLVHGITKK
jgi:hypothetical protein